MSTLTPQTDRASAYVLDAGKGEHLWHLGVSWHVKLPATASAEGLFIAEHCAPLGMAPPVHRHHKEDEAWYVLDGQFRFYLGDEQRVVGAGGFVWGPRGEEHTFRAETDRARMLVIVTPAGFEGFLRDTGTPAGDPGMPPPSDGPPNVDVLLAAMTEHGIDFISPPPH